MSGLACAGPGRYLTHNVGFLAGRLISPGCDHSFNCTTQYINLLELCLRHYKYELSEDSVLDFFVLANKTKVFLSVQKT